MTSASSNVVQLPLNPLFRVRVAQAGLPAYHHVTRAEHPFDLWQAEADRLAPHTDSAMISILRQEEVINNG